MYNRFSWIGVTFILESLYMYYTDQSLYPLDTKVFVTFTLVSYFLWTEIGVLLQLLPDKIRIIFVSLLSFLWVLNMATGYYIYREFKEFFSSGLYLFLKENPIYFKSYVKQIIHNPIMLLPIILFTILFTWFLSKKMSLPKQKYYLITILIIFAVINWKFNTGKRSYQNDFIPMDIHGLYTLKLGMKNMVLKPLRHIVDPDTQVLKDSITGKEALQWNIVLVVFKSVSREPLSFYGYDNDYTPFMKHWIEREKDQFVLMQDAMAISGATDVSMPTMYTGVEPEEKYSKLTAAPFMWDYAKQKGYETCIATSQSQEWKGFRHFVKDQNLDHYFYPEKLNLPLIHDVGADDLTVLQHIKDTLLQIKQPFFFYYNTNATHGPYQNASPYIKDFGDVQSRYGKALFITDKIVETIVSILKEKGAYDRTIFIFTADHGDYAVKRRQRLSSFFKEALSIPMMFRFPKAWIAQHPEAYKRIQQNANKRIINLDIAPTVYGA